MDGIVQNLVRNKRCPALEEVDTVVAQSSMIAVYPGDLSDNDRAPPNSRVRTWHPTLLGIGSGNAVARYIRHIDNPIDDGRILTVMVYLNPDSWEMSSHGGVGLIPLLCEIAFPLVTGTSGIPHCRRWLGSRNGYLPERRPVISFPQRSSTT